MEPINGKVVSSRIHSDTEVGYRSRKVQPVELLYVWHVDMFERNGIVLLHWLYRHCWWWLVGVESRQGRAAEKNPVVETLLWHIDLDLTPAAVCIIERQPKTRLRRRKLQIFSRDLQLVVDESVLIGAWPRKRRALLCVRAGPPQSFFIFTLDDRNVN